MKKNLLVLALITFGTHYLMAQTTGAKSSFHYRITKKKLDKLNAKNIYIQNTASPNLQICSTDNVFKCVINNNKGTLDLDGWSYIRSNAVCNTPGVIGSTTSTGDLKIVIPKRNTLGDPTWVVTIPYRSLIFSVNTIQLKIRPGVTDYMGNKWSSNVIAGTYNLGLNFGYSFGWTNFTARSSNNYSITPGINFGFGSASLSKEPLSRAIDTKYTPSNFVFSPALSCVLARNDIGIILATGPDYMTGRDHSAWALQGKWTFGLGVNAAFKL
ncbi:hypothetical protein [Mucilaginibacter sp. CSA2-8R]|uniref:hypothetical protein n=1 Tax=Mucilaginibacter sp. CSA2-8R TaxID=3141542 RepID=UPI00315CADB3